MSKQPAWTIGRLIEWTRKHFEAKGVDAPRLATELLLARALGCRKIELYTRFDQIPAPAQLDAFRASVKAAAAGRPVAHLLGHKEFYGIDFEVTAGTLIPRPETETLVDQALVWCRDQDRAVQVLDLGTGTGCIGLALCANHAQVQVLATDIDPRVVEVAARNAQRHDLAERFIALEADGLDLPMEHVPERGFDAIVSNPPYIALEDPAVQSSVREFEPHVALFAGSDGLDFYRRIAAGAAAILQPQGTLFVEIGYDQHDAVIEIMTAQSAFETVESFRDHLEGHLRVIVFRRSAAPS